jgi:hypothetical protein
LRDLAQNDLGIYEVAHTVAVGRYRLVGAHKQPCRFEPDVNAADIFDHPTEASLGFFEFPLAVVVAVERYFQNAAKNQAHGERKRRPRSFHAEPVSVGRVGTQTDRDG